MVQALSLVGVVVFFLLSPVLRADDQYEKPEDVVITETPKQKSSRIPRFSEVVERHASTEKQLFDSKKRLVYQFRGEYKGRVLPWVPLDQFSPTVLQALLAAEDNRFYDHSGVDHLALMAGLKDSVFGKVKRGSSTITMQLVGLLGLEEVAPRQRRTFWQKYQQIQLAKELEENWSKSEILEAYLNMIPMRGELIGIPAGSKGIFFKDSSALSATEALFLSVLVRSPNADWGIVRKRACLLYQKMHPEETECTEVESYPLPPIRPPSYKSQLNPGEFVYSHYAKLFFPSGQKQFYSTLDSNLVQFSFDILRNTVSSLASKNTKDGAVLVLDNATGNVLAYVANTGDLSTAKYVDGIQSPRQAGSTLKPFLYGLVLSKGYMEPDSMIEDTPLEIVLPQGVYRPNNYEKTTHGLVSLRTALGSSLNLPAVRIVELVGVDSFLGILSEFGFQNVQKRDFYGASLALGAVDITLWELVHAYRQLALGTKTSLRTRALRDIADILSDRSARELGFGNNSPQTTRVWSASKTGTSQDMRDNWCVGFTNRYTVGVWVGNFSGEPMWNSSGVVGACPVWREIIHYLHKDQPSQSPWEGKETREESLAREQNVQIFKIPLSKPRILSPQDGTYYSLDPDIPEKNERILWESSDWEKGMKWILNGKLISEESPRVIWKPFRGIHQLELRNVENKRIDFVSFEVR